MRIKKDKPKKRRQAQEPQEEFLLDPQGRPVVVPLMGPEIVGEFEPRDEDEAKVYKNLGVEGVMQLRDMKGAVREGRGKFAKGVLHGAVETARYLPVVGEAIDALEVINAFRTGKDLYGEEVDPELLAGLTAAGLLVPNIIEKPLKAIGKGVKTLKRSAPKVLKKSSPKVVKSTDVSRKVSTPEAELESWVDYGDTFDWGKQPTPSEKIIRANTHMYDQPVSDSMVAQTKENLMSWMGSNEYRNRVLNAVGGDEALADQVISRNIDNLKMSDHFIVNAQDFQTRNIGEGPVDWEGLAYRGPDHDLALNNPSIVLSESAGRGDAAHELGHISMPKKEISNAAKSVDTPKLTESAKKSLEGETFWGMPLSEYHSDPDEIRSRAIEVIDATRNANVTTDEMVDAWLDAKAMKESLPPGAYDAPKTMDQYNIAKRYYDMYRATPSGLKTLIEDFDPKEVKNYLNKVYALLPVAGVGAVAATQSIERSSSSEKE